MKNRFIVEVDLVDNVNVSFRDNMDKALKEMIEELLAEHLENNSLVKSWEVKSENA